MYRTFTLTRKHKVYGNVFINNLRDFPSILLTNESRY